MNGQLQHMSRAAFLQRVVGGLPLWLRAEWGCGSRPAGVLRSTSGAPRLHRSGQAVGRPESLELRAHHACQPVLSNRLRALFFCAADCPRETLEALVSPLATVVLS